LVEQADGLAVASSFEGSAQVRARPSLSGRRKANEERPNEVPSMMILVAAMFLLTLVLLALYLHVSGVFTNRRTFQTVLRLLTPLKMVYEAATMTSRKFLYHVRN
jgi:hypothetical protein